MPGSKQRLAMVIPNYYPVTCGIGDFTMRLTRELVGRGAEVALFTQAPAAPNPECSSIKVFAAEGRTPLQTASSLRELIVAFDPSEVFVHYVPHMLGASRFGSPAVPALMAHLKGRARVTAVFHELYFAWTWRPDLVLAATLQRLQFSAALGLADRVFVTTAARKRSLETMLRSSGRDTQVELLFVGANAPPLPRPPPGRTGNPVRRRLGVFSMLRRGRHFDAMIDAFEIVHQRHPDTELVLIGDFGTDASQPYRALKEHIARSPVAQHVRLTGALPLWRVAEEVAALDVYLFPDENGASTRSSTLPIALGSGVPVIATCGADTATDFFVDGQNIIFIPNLGAPALAAAALRVLEEPSWAAKLSLGGRLLYEQHLSWPVIAEQVLPRAVLE